MAIEHRHFKRVLGQRFGNCRVQLTVPHAIDAVLVDISAGGMKILVEKNPAEAAIAPGTQIKGEIGNESPAFEMKFSAAVAWQRPSVLDGQAAVAVGLQFADFTPLPDALMHLIENYDAV
ncbi:MAG: PilZ domain-containing protein [Turneriella sp.]|nr:PilZ domain-containing protein [Turneriella sp.]